MIWVRIEIRGDCVLLDGYVNAVGRDSRPIITPYGRSVEQIEPGAFARAVSRAENIDLLLDHDKNRKLGSTKEGNLELFEDNIGLRAVCTVTDKEVIQKAENGMLKGWSFGMLVNSDEKEERAENIPRRIVKDLELTEVSIIDERMRPCYTGTSIEQRANQEILTEQRGNEFQAVTENISKISYESYEKRIKKIKGLR